MNNDELKGAAMSITDELREHFGKSKGVFTDHVLAIADRIDAEHERLMAEQFESLTADMQPMTDENMAEHGWVRLPVDEDGEYIRIGDVLIDDVEFKSEGKVVRLMLEDEGWAVGLGCDWWSTPSLHEWHHHHAPTVEDVLREFAQEMSENLGMYTGEAIDADEWRDADAKTIATYAAKLRLRGDE